MKEEDKKRRVEEKMARALREEEIRRLMQEAQVEPPKPRNEEETEIQITCELDEHWKKILANYKKEFPQEEMPNNHTYRFPSVQAAEDFFTKQAQEGSEFLGTWGKDGKRTDDHLFSCGDGKLYTGSFAKIHQDLQDALKAETSPERKAKISKGLERIKNCMPQEQNPAVEMRNKLQESKKAADTQENTANQSEDLWEEQSSAITPFAKAPNPFK